MDSSENSSEIIEQLVYLRRVTEISGVIHEAQIQQIKLFWGLLTDGAGKSFAIDFDQKIIEFRMAEFGEIQPNMIKPFYEAMEFVLGNGWAYRFVKGTEEMFI